jgi:hypothetical protein
MSYTYTTKMGTLREFLTRAKSKELGVPDKVTMSYLSSIGYKSSRDRPIIRILKSINFIDDNGVPTESFVDFRTAKSKQVMASALRRTYADLFRTYADPMKQDTKDLTNFFAEKEPSLKAGTLQYYVNTLKVLCEFADFGAPPLEPKGKDKEEGKAKKGQLLPPISPGVTINLNIQLTLPVTDDATVYDKIFKALKENLLSTD